MTRSEVPCTEVGYAELKGIADKVRLYRVPRSAEPGALPFGGRALDRVRDRLGSVIPVEALAPAVEHARGLARKSSSLALSGFAWWQVEVRRSRVVQVITIAVLIGLIALLVWGMTPRQTPMQKFRRSLGF